MVPLLPPAAGRRSELQSVSYYCFTLVLVPPTSQLIQQRCQVCAGKGLVPSSREGAKYVRKCPQCGGFFPWVSWKLFLTSTAAPGNGGPLQYPKGQDSVFFKVGMGTRSGRGWAMAVILGPIPGPWYVCLDEPGGKGGCQSTAAWHDRSGTRSFQS